MSAITAILDASAIVALVRKERGWETVLRIVTAGVAATTPTGLGEALITCSRKGYRGTRSELADDLKELGVMVEPLIEDDGEEIAFLLERADELAAADGALRGRLSLGDAACLAVAHRLGVIAVMSDGTWEILEIPGLKVRPFR